MDRLRIAVIGLGWFGEIHCEAIIGIPHLELAALCTRTPERLQALAKKFGVKVDKGGIFPYKGEDGTVTKLVRGVTIARWTFVIDRTGTVVLRDTKTNAAQDSQRVLDEVKKLQK